MNQDTKCEDKAENSQRPIQIPWLTSILIPLVVASIPATVSVFVAYGTLQSQESVTSLKRLEVLNLVIENFSSEKPERTLVSLELIKVLGDLDENMTRRVELYAMNLTEQKLQDALQEGGQEGASKVEEVFAAVKSASGKASNSIREKIESKKFHIVVVSATKKEYAEEFRDKLISEGFKDSLVFQTSKGFGVSLGEFTFKEAKDLQKKFEALKRFHQDFPNKADLYETKPSIRVIE